MFNSQVQITNKFNKSQKFNSKFTKRRVLSHESTTVKIHKSRTEGII